MIALRPFYRKIGAATVPVKQGKEIPKIILDSYTEVELKEMKEKKIIGDSVKKTEQKPDSNNNNRKEKK